MKTLDILDVLLGFDTTSARSNLEMIDWIAGQMQARGITPVRIMNDAGTKANLYATIGGDGAGVMLSGHTDVVPVDGQDWSFPPFAATRKDGRVYGRGAADMKGFLAAALSMAFAAADRDLVTPLHLAFSYDEEIGCIGVRSMIDMLAKAPQRPRLCIVGEPTGMAVATGHKGKLAARALCRGRAGHSALAPQALNAIHLASDLVAAIRELQADLAGSGARDPAYDVPYSTLHVGRIAGGVALNIVPETCTLDFEIRNLAGDDAGELLEQIRARAAAIVAQADDPSAAIEIEVVNSYPGLDTDEAGWAVEFVRSLTGSNRAMKVAFGTEGGLFSRDLGVPTVVCGPGDMAQGHKADEYVSEAQLAQCDAMLARLLERLEVGL